jgi:hypothetical protein
MSLALLVSAAALEPISASVGQGNEYIAYGKQTKTTIVTIEVVQYGTTA